MVRHVDAIFSEGALRPLALPDGARVHLRVEEETIDRPLRTAAKIHTPRLAHPEDAGDFVMEVRVGSIRRNKKLRASHHR